MADFLAIVGMVAFTAVMLVLPPLGITALAIASKPAPEERWIPVAMVAGFLALMLPLAAEVFRVRHHVTDESILRVTPWSRRARVEWQHIHRVSWNQSMMWLALEAEGGTVVRLSGFVSGLGTFVERARRHLPGHVRNAVETERAFARCLSPYGRQA